MSTPFRRLLGALAFALAGAASLPAHAGPYTSMYVFGDSLSDTGNLNVATGGAQPAPGQPYFNGRFSDGPVWVETLAAGLGLSADVAPALLGGNNYAFAGARMGTSSTPPGVLAQIAGLWAPSHPLADPNALYVVVGGGNDMRDARDAFQGNSVADQTGRQGAAVQAATRLANAVGLLALAGARHVLIANLPDLGATPEANLLGLAAASTDVTQRFNLLVGGLEQSLEATFTNLDVDLLDMAGLSAAIRNNPGDYGFTNTTAPCAGFLFSGGASCATSLFSDALHPSAAAHRLLGQAALSLVPVPGSAWLTAVALMALGVSRRRVRG